MYGQRTSSCNTPCCKHPKPMRISLKKLGIKLEHPLVRLSCSELMRLIDAYDDYISLNNRESGNVNWSPMTVTEFYEDQFA